MCVQPEFMHEQHGQEDSVQMPKCRRKSDAFKGDISDHAFSLKPSMAPLPEDERLWLGIQHSSSFMTCLTTGFCLSYSCHISTLLPFPLPHSGAAASAV